MRALVGAAAWLAFLIWLTASIVWAAPGTEDTLATKPYPWGLYHVVDWGRDGSTVPDPQFIEHAFFLSRFAGQVECRRFARAMATRAVAERSVMGEAIAALALPHVGWLTIADEGRWTRTRLVCRGVADGVR